MRAKRTTSSRASRARPFPLQQNEPQDGQSYFSARSGKVKKFSTLLLGGGRRRGRGRRGVHRRRGRGGRSVRRNVNDRLAAALRLRGTPELVHVVALVVAGPVLAAAFVGPHALAGIFDLEDGGLEQALLLEVGLGRPGLLHLR